MAAVIQILLILTLSHLATGQIRLMIQTTVNTQQGVGRVEVLLGGQWIPVCSTNWLTNPNNAIVACRSAGFTGGGTTFQNVAIYGQSGAFFRLDSVSCTGTEASLLDCSFAACFNCSDRDVVGVTCNTQTSSPTTIAPATNACGSGFPVRLMIQGVTNTANAVGRVEVCVNAMWLPVCDTNWLTNTNNANVACRSAGYANGGVTFINEAIYGKSSSVFHLDSMNCAGSESTILSCAYVLCLNCTRQVGVSCTPPNSQNSNGSSITATPLPPGIISPAGVCGNLPTVSVSTDGSVRLVGREAGIGYVCVRAPNNTFGHVCDDYWDLLAARVICRQLGLQSFDFAEPNLPLLYKLPIPSPVTFVLDDVRCRTGQETSIQNCPHNAWFDHDCTSPEVAAVSCVGPPPNNSTLSKGIPTLLCNDGHFVVIFSKSQFSNLRPGDLSIAEPFVGACTFNPQEDTQSVRVRVDFNECGTRVTQNATHIIYTEKIRVANTDTSTAIITREQEAIEVEVCCQIPRNTTVTRTYQVVTSNPKKCEEGVFNISMWIYQNLSTSNAVRVLNYPYKIPLGDWLDFAMELYTQDERLKLVVTNCRAWRGLNVGTQPSYPLYTRKCQADPDLQLIPISRTNYGFRIPCFKFRNGPDSVVLECDAIVCLTTETTNECDRSCNSNKPAPPYSSPWRRRRQAENETANTNHTVVTVTSGPIYFIKDDNTSSTTTLVLSPAALLPVTPATKKPDTISMTTATTSTTTPVLSPAALPPVTPATKKPDTISTTTATTSTTTTVISPATLPPVTPATKKPDTTSTTTATTTTTTTTTSTQETPTTTTVSHALDSTTPGVTGWVSVSIIPARVVTSSPSSRQAPKAADVDARLESALSARPGQAPADDSSALGDVQIEVDGTGADRLWAAEGDSPSGGNAVAGSVSVWLALFAALRLWKTLCDRN